jgi:hypothetical protein
VTTIHDRLASLEEASELLEQRTSGRRDFGSYRDDPLGFLRDVLRIELATHQQRIARAVLDHPLVAVRSCHAAGKDYVAAGLALWWAYARGGLVVLTGPTSTQVEEIIMRRYLHQFWRGSRLWGDLHVRALRLGSEAAILARTGASVSAMTGFHAERVLYVITEAQDPAIAHAWDAGYACTTGSEDRFLTLCNPTEPDGRAFAAHRPGSGWHAIRIAASEVIEAGVPGMMSAEAVQRFAREYGTDSPAFISRVLGEFPEQSEAALLKREDVDAALRRWHPRDVPAPVLLGVDPARMGPDRTAVCVRRLGPQGSKVLRFYVWKGLDTQETAAKVAGLVSGYSPCVRGVWVDEIGLGGGVLDRLRVLLPKVDCRGFIASARSTLPERFRNKRAHAFWHLRDLLREGRISLPARDGLREELLALRVNFAADGRTEIGPKDEMRTLLGRSPDLADAVAISFGEDIEARGGKIARVAK